MKIRIGSKFNKFVRFYEENEVIKAIIIYNVIQNVV